MERKEECIGVNSSWRGSVSWRRDNYFWFQAGRKETRERCKAKERKKERECKRSEKEKSKKKGTIRNSFITERKRKKQ